MNTKTKTNKAGKGYTSTYFKQELYTAMEEMTDATMNDLLKDLTDTKYWVAISRYVENRLKIANSSLAVMDPFKDPTNIARAQGIMSGLMDLQDMTEKIKESIKAAEKKAQLKVEVSEGGSEDPEDVKPY